ncbi:MAG: outer membrane protein assembly factor BamD [Candidatus Lambdaproteobacteria bacterium]|nr:outer membrane protein assembly factor BamD [Candidatus Lambdaproteobacteria bacterium]
MNARKPPPARRPAPQAAAARVGLALVVALVPALALGTAPPLRAQQPERLTLGEPELWSFAESLYRQGEHFRAISEYRRLVFFFPQGANALDARIRIGQAYLRGGEPRRALDAFGDVLRDPSAAAAHDRARYGRGLSWLELEPERPYPLRAPAIASALEEFRALAPAWPGRERVTGFVAATEHPPPLPAKSPLLAGALSAVVPGTGSFYVGRYAEGSLALFVTGVLAYAAGSSFRADQPAAGTVFGAAALAFYGGSIYAAASGAHKFNDRTRAAYLERQRQRFGIVLAPAGVAGAFSVDF